MPSPEAAAPRRPPAASGAERLRVLVLAESLPWPPLKGGDHRTWQHVHALARTARVGVFGLCSNDARRARPPRLPLAFWSASDDPALASPPPKGVRLPGRAWLFEPDGHPSDLHHSPVAADQLAQRLAAFRPHVALVASLWLRRYLDVLAGAGCRIVLDCHNVEALVAREVGGTREGSDLESRVIREVLPARTEAIERAALARADRIWTCSDADAQQLRAVHAPRAPVVVVPNAIRMRARPPRRPGPGTDGPLTLLLPGTWAYPPNTFAASFLMDRVLPDLAAASERPCRLELVGPTPTPGMRAAARRDPRIAVPGPVPDLRPFFDRATLMAVPVFHGGGTRLKVLEAFEAGLPVVSTAKGVEGLGAEPDRHFVAAESVGDFVEEILALDRDERRARRLARQARALAAERFSWAVTAPRIRAAVHELVRPEARA